MATRNVKEVLIRMAEELTDDCVYPTCHNIKRKMIARYSMYVCTFSAREYKGKETELGNNQSRRRTGESKHGNEKTDNECEVGRM